MLVEKVENKRQLSQEGALLKKTHAVKESLFYVL
jgi:hypothetical protein